MCSQGYSHVPVLLDACVELLGPRPDELVIDATLGGASHALALASRLGPRGFFVGFDRDPDAIAAARHKLQGLSCRVELVQSNFRELGSVLEGFGVSQGSHSVHRVLADLGVSSHQLDTPERGFSFSHDGPLDMRMGQSGASAADLLDGSSEAELVRLLAEGDVKRPRAMARAMLEARSQGSLSSTAALRSLCERRIPHKRGQIHPATLVFQALRIAVNDELGALASLLDTVPALMAAGSRLGIITFHSGEDRIVKQRMKHWQRPCECPPRLPYCACSKRSLGRMLADVVASDDEQRANPRSRSARLRVFEFAL